MWDIVGGTRGSGIVSIAADVLWMSMVRVMKGLGVVCEMCLNRSGERKRVLGFTNRVGVLDVICVSFPTRGVCP